MSHGDNIERVKSGQGVSSSGRRWVRPVVLVFLGLVLGLALAAGWAYRTWVSDPAIVDSMPLEVQVRIPQGMTLKAAADTLVAKKLLGDATLFRLGARLSGQDRGLRAGLYALKQGTSPRNLLSDLTTGRSVHIKFTIPEGLNVDEISVIVAGALDFSPEEFLAVADSIAHLTIKDRQYMGSDSTFAAFDSLIVDKTAWVNRQPHWCEGYLAPDTYLFAEGTAAPRVAAHLIQTQSIRLDRARKQASGKLVQYLSDHELLTLASIVEAEARRDDERAKIAAVYSNRLLQRWRLQADPTVAFILQKKGKRIYFKDLKTPSPFNTYENKGLPPGPIAAPGFLSLLAAAAPEPQSKDMFFVSDGFDGHAFSRTAQEHEKAVLRFRRFQHGTKH